MNLHVLRREGIYFLHYLSPGWNKSSAIGCRVVCLSR